MTFKARFLAENPDDIVFTLKLTMTAGEWEKLRDSLNANYPSWKLKDAINDMLAQARKVFYPTEATHE